jgi:hypothetical protein
MGQFLVGPIAETIDRQEIYATIDAASERDTE